MLLRGPFLNHCVGLGAAEDEEEAEWKAKQEGTFRALLSGPAIRSEAVNSIHMPEWEHSPPSDAEEEFRCSSFNAYLRHRHEFMRWLVQKKAAKERAEQEQTWAKLLQRKAELESQRAKLEKQRVRVERQIEAAQGTLEVRKRSRPDMPEAQAELEEGEDSEDSKEEDSEAESEEEEFQEQGQDRSEANEAEEVEPKSKKGRLQHLKDPQDGLYSGQEWVFEHGYERPHEPDPEDEEFWAGVTDEALAKSRALYHTWVSTLPDPRDYVTPEGWNAELAFFHRYELRWHQFLREKQISF